MSTASTRAETREELLFLALGVADGSIRAGLCDEIVPLIAHPQCANALAAFAQLVAAVRAGDEATQSRLLDALAGVEVAA